jgi:hypothetical protein
MQKHQKFILIKFAVVIIVTVLGVVAMINFKDWINRSEAMLAMGNLGEVILKYRAENGFVPPESYINSIRPNLPGNSRLGDSFRYRALWLNFDSPPDTILAYAPKKYRSLILKDGVIVLRLDGHVEWLETKDFETLLAKQQSPLEKQITPQAPGSGPIQTPQRPRVSDVPHPVR